MINAKRYQKDDIILMAISFYSFFTITQRLYPISINRILTAFIIVLLCIRKTSRKDKLYVIFALVLLGLYTITISINKSQNINDFIYSSDYVLSKPGGLSSTEIASIHKPLLHIYPIPGIETYNTLFFGNNKMSIKCDTDKEIIDNIKYLMSNEDICKEMIQNQKKIINENSASDLVKFILDHFN